MLYAVWQVLGHLTHREVAGAKANALAVWHAQQALHLPSELTLQHAILGHALAGADGERLLPSTATSTR